MFHVEAGEVLLHARGGVGRPLPLRRRPPWFSRFVEGPVARVAMGVRTYGTSSTGVREWYQADRYRPLREAAARLGGEDLGPLLPAWEPIRVGFTEPPGRPSWVDVHPVLEDPSGHLDEVLLGPAPVGRRRAPRDAGTGRSRRAQVSAVQATFQSSS